MTWLIGLALKLGIPERFAKYAVIAALVFGTLTILGVAKCSYDRNIIKSHDAKQDAANSKADRKADTTAAVQRRADDARITQETNELKEAQNGATDNLDRRLAFQRCLRLQQSARRDGKQPPACH